jgi:hypothetical protein
MAPGSIILASLGGDSNLLAAVDCSSTLIGSQTNHVLKWFHAASKFESAPNQWWRQHRERKRPLQELQVLGGGRITANRVCPGLVGTGGSQTTPHKDARDYVKATQASRSARRLQQLQFVSAT